MKSSITFLMAAQFVLNISALAQEPTRYMEPPKELMDIIDAPTTPSLSINPTKTYVLFAYPQEMPDISELAQPELRLAGVRINPENYGVSKPRFWQKLSIRKIDSNSEYPITGLPDGGSIKLFQWSPNGKQVAIVFYTPKTIELWVAEVETGLSRRWATNLHDALVSSPIEWAPDSKSILYTSRVLYREPFPQSFTLPEGPAVQQTSGVAAQVRTFQDMLQNHSDEAKFEHYATSCIMRVSQENETIVLGNPGLITNFSASPNNEYILVEQIMRPFSYTVPYYRFPTWIDIWTSDGKFFKKLAEIPLAESIPQGFSAVRMGPRNHQWRSDVPATLVWVEAQDEGDPKKETEVRDMVFYLSAPFNAEPTPFLALNLRFASIGWGWDQLAVVNESWRETRRVVTSFFNPSQVKEPKRVIWDRSRQDLYGDPGRLITETNNQGFSTLRTNSKRTKLYLSGQGASPSGSMPFLDEMEIKTLKTTRKWQCQAPYYEIFYSFLDPTADRILTSRESNSEQPNYFIRDLKRKNISQFTSFPHPFPQLENIQQEQIRYKRDDGIELTATLYLPSGFKKGSQSLPVLMWAYPEEFVDANLASQVKDSPNRFTRPSRLSPVLWITRGYAVLDRMGMPIVKQDTLEPNDTFIEQLVSNAKAAVDYLVDTGIADPNRIAIGGHSYGAFMAANLLAHTDLFAAGIARSGAYNRTLTPFGFQGEERNLWQAPETYLRMSPFMYAHKILAPILFIHGEDDNNSGTFPMQTERMYSAIKGHGGTARMVILPFEGHGYRARQSILHSVWEMDCWLEKYLKQAI